MKILQFILVVLAIATLVPLASADIQLPWASLDGGGGSSGGSTFALRGTIGQFDAGRQSGGNYSVEGGFGNRVETSLGPLPGLTILHSGSNIQITWPQPAAGFQLEWSSVLDGTVQWNTVASPYLSNATHISHSEPLTGGPRFYRLKRQR
jgi:hypothetical protein